ncbi:polysaccharide deacetylase family protein (plasmid) [Rhizobium sp. CB3171]|uniref:polysaccharide deacetylase family protein n=1 Tax=unclassified Rhizobium TaxID=2613769 RepID=UPI0021A2B713|nr:MULTISPECIES: polysaccharide deacetylase family protein [Rhizobium]MDK4740135.1 polysaccharide deacetylase family protein [Rhizobium sp. CNPSo 3464]UWU25045.1 polysaccharide deacetylase family protein [Rhizobium tropici]WFU06380.1 polysaccharide deacetylase family protein [Rhizobium sp. CB3171]
MSNRAAWQPLRNELQRWADAGRRAKLWFRDDDAVEPTEALDRLLALSDRHSVPVTLAVIPAHTSEPLATRLASQKDLTVTVHGWTHHNYAPDEAKKQELGPHRPHAIILDELRQGFDKLKVLYPQQFAPMLVPPWNRIDKALLPGLAAFGYRAVSVYGLAKPDQPIALINTHVDIMDWHGTHGGWPHAELVGYLVRELQNRFDGNSEPIGILTHHLVHDALAWDFIATLFEETAAHAAIDWRHVGDFMGQQQHA